MKNKKFPLVLLILFLINNGMSLITQDMKRAEILKDNSQPVLLMKEDKNEGKKNELKKEEEKQSSNTKYNSRNQIKSDNNLREIKEQKNNNLSEDMNYSDIGIPSLDELNDLRPIDMNLVGGIVTIPKIDMSINILKGTNHENLKYGATTGLDNQKMGQGNYVLFGHNMETKHVMFSDLKDLEKGDDIILTNRDKREYQYEVVSKKVISKNQTDVLNETDDSIVTLINCSSVTPEGKKISANKTPYRLVVVGKLKK